MTRQEIQTACEQAYHWMHKVKEALEANDKLSHGPASVEEMTNEEKK